MPKEAPVPFARQIFIAAATSDSESPYDLAIPFGRRGLQTSIRYGFWKELLNMVQPDSADSADSHSHFDGFQTEFAHALMQAGLDSDMYYYFLVWSRVSPQAIIYSDPQTVAIVRQLETRFNYVLVPNRIMPEKLQLAIESTLSSCQFKS